MTAKPAAVIVLAAGEGKRMKSRTPKVLHEIGGRPLVGHVARAGLALSPEHLVVVVGNGRDRVIAYLADLDPAIRPVVQEEQNGTGHATRIALDELPQLSGTVIVATGDTPLLTAETLRQLAETHAGTEAAATVLTAVVDDPTGYGRVLRDSDGAVLAIVEHRDATEEQRAIAEINSGIWAFDAQLLVDALGRLKSDNAQGEEYVTDVLGLLREEGHRVSAAMVGDPREVLGVNNRVQLAELGRIMNDRVLTGWMMEGVTVVDPATTWVDDTVTLARDVVLQPGTILRGATSVGEGASVGPDTTLTSVVVGAEASVVRTHGEGAFVGVGASVGPFAYLRPGTRLGDGGKIGTFVETKNAEIGPGAKVPHLTYAGDTTIGAGANIGAGTIFANYDGVHKNHTDVGEHSFVGSNSVLVAPVSIADGSYVAAGSTVAKSVSPGELAVARGQQRNIAGWVARKRAGTKTAAAAERAAEADSAGDA